MILLVLMRDSFRSSGKWVWVGWVNSFNFFFSRLSEIYNLPASLVFGPQKPSLVSLRKGIFDFSCTKIF